MLDYSVLTALLEMACYPDVRFFRRQDQVPRDWLIS